MLSPNTADMCWKDGALYMDTASERLIPRSAPTESDDASSLASADGGRLRSPSTMQGMGGMGSMVGGMGMGRGAMPLPTSREAWARTFASLRIHGYRLLFISMMASFMGMQMQMIARNYLTFDLAGEAGSVGAVSSAWGLPMLAFSLLGGVVADRLEKRNIMVMAQIVSAALAIGNAVLIQAGLIEIWHLVVFGLIQGTVFAFNMPSRQAIIPELVGEKEMMNAIALNSAGMNLTRILGPSVAGILIAIAFINISGVFYIVGFLNLISALTLMQLPVSDDAWAKRRSQRPLLSDMFSGLVYIKQSPILFTLISMGLIVILFSSPYQMLLVVFAREVYDVGSQGFGVLSTATGVGALVGSLWVASLMDARRRGMLQLIVGFALGIALLLFALNSYFWLALVLLIPLGLVSNAFMALNNTMIMSYTDHQVRGRIMGVYMMTFSLTPLAVWPMGELADRIGIQLTVAIAAIIMLVYVVLVAILRPSYRQIE